VLGVEDFVPGIEQPTITPRCDVAIEITPHGVYTKVSQEFGYIWSIGSDGIQIDSLEK
jgi:hypothetical protein